MGFTESFLSGKILSHEISVENYHCLRRDRIDKGGGGIVVYIKENWNYIRRNDLCHNQVESIWIELCIPNRKHILIGYFYRPPYETVSWNSLFEKQIHKAKETDLHIMVLGDFNVNLFKCSPHSNWSILYKSFNLEQIVKAPTRLTEKTCTLLDHIYISHGIPICEVAVANLSISDHLPTAVNINYTRPSGMW